MDTTNEKQFKRVAFDDFLPIKVKGKSAMLPILVFSHFFSKEGRGRERSKGERSWLSVAFHSAGKGIALVATTWVCPFFAQFGEEWPYCSSRVPPIVHFRKITGLRTRLNLSSYTLSSFLTRKSQKFKIVIPPFVQ